MSIRPAATLLACALAGIGLLVGSASASHAGAEVTCDTGDTFTLRAVDNGAGFQSPGPADVLIFEEGGILTIFSASVDGNLLFSNAVTGQANNARDEVTCSFTIGAGAVFEVTGLLNER
jgi:hypothetical protein